MQDNGRIVEGLKNIFLFSIKNILKSGNLEGFASYINILGLTI